VNIAKRYNLTNFLNSADVNIAKIKGRIELLNEQIECCKKQADEQGLNAPFHCLSLKEVTTYE
jgi:hypothetical protein